MGQGHTAVHADRQSGSMAFRGNSARDLTLVLRIRGPMNSLDLRLSVQVCPKDSLTVYYPHLFKGLGLCYCFKRTEKSLPRDTEIDLINTKNNKLSLASLSPLIFVCMCV